MATFEEWWKKKKEQQESNAETAAQYANQNAGQQRSGQNRDQYDAGVRAAYGARNNTTSPATGTEYSAEWFADMQRNANTLAVYEEAARQRQAAAADAQATLDNLQAQAAATKRGAAVAYFMNRQNPNGAGASLYNDMMEKYNSLTQQYEEMSGAAQEVFDGYTDAVNRYNAEAEEARQYGEQYNAWRGSIRSRDEIAADMESTEAELIELYKERALLESRRTAVSNGTPAGNYMLAQVESQLGEVNTRIAALESKDLKTEMQWAESFYYNDMTANEDFAELSRYQSKTTGEGATYNPILGAYESSGSSDIWYDYINKDETAREIISHNDSMYGSSFMGVDKAELLEMTDDEVAVFNYLYAQDEANGDTEHTNAYDYIRWLNADLNQRERARQQQKWAAMVQENPGLMSAFSVVAAPLKGVAYLNQVADAASGEIDPNSSSNRLATIPADIRNAVASNWGPVGSFAYQTAMSMADFLFTTAISGGNQAIALGIMGSGAAADTTLAAKERGISDGRALFIGAAAGAAEAAFERIGMDALFDFKTLGKSGFRYFVQNALSEAGEEMGTELTNAVVDLIFAWDKSEMAQAVQEYKAQGADNPIGKAIADKALDVLVAGAGGLISGGVIGGAGAVIGGAVTNRQAEAVLANPQAVQVLEQYAQLQLNDNMTKSQQRAAVKSAMERLASSQDGMAALQQATSMQPQAVAQETAERPVQGREAVQQFAQNMDKAAATVMEGMYIEGDDAFFYIEGMSRAYADGKNGVTNEPMGITQQQYEAMYKAGETQARALAQQEQESYIGTNNEEGITNGKTAEVSVRDGSQRIGSEDTGRQVSRVEESTGRNQGWKIQGRHADPEAASLTFGEEVSLAALGVGNGSARATLRKVVGGDTASTAEAKRIARERGLRLVLVAGDSLRVYQGKRWVEARALVVGDRMFVRADHPVYTADQLTRHEAGHDMINKGEIDPAKIRERLQETGYDVQTVTAMYEEAYRGTGYTAEEIWNEIVCDSLGDMNIFAGQETEAAAENLLSGSRRVASETAAKTDTERGPPEVQTSVEVWPDGKKYVRADRQVIFGNDPDSWSEQLENYINGKIRRGQNVSLVAADGDVLTLTAATAGKVSSHWMGVRWVTGEDFERKINAGTHIDELATASLRGSRNAPDEEAKHGDMAKDGWNYRTAYFLDFDGKYYECTISISKGSNGNAVYNIGAMRKRSVPTFTGSSADGGAQSGKASTELKVTQKPPAVKSEVVGVSVDSESESAYPTVFTSLETWSKSQYVSEREKAALELAANLGISKSKALAYIDTVNSIAKMIADDRTRLDYEASPDVSSFVSNAEYGGSIDFSTICKKRRLFTGTFEAIQRALPDTALTADEVLEIRSMMDKKGYEVSCGLCYVEGSRANMGQFTKQFLERYAETNPEYLPNMAEMNTATGQEKLRREHPEVYKAYEYFMNHYGRLKPTDKALFASQQKPKMYQLATEYRNEILKKFRNKAKSVEEKNRNGGLRIQSFSDFEIIHLIDSMQVIMDMANVGLAGQAYTKMPDFAWALGDTGLKINLSLIAKGIDSNGRLLLDEKEGMSVEDAMALRDRYSENVGTIVVVFTDNQLKAAMADERIDFIIPFHRSQWKTEQYEIMGLPANAKDFTNWQNEAYIKPVYNQKGKKLRPDNYMPNTYWDFSKSGKENAEAYLQMCAANNRRPKFHYLLVNNNDGSYSLQPDGSTDGYWKTLIDFKMYDNNGVGSPQMPVRPDFNMEQAQRMLNDYTGGHSEFPAAQDIVDEFVSKYKAEHEGNIIPLSKRFNLTSPDIHYSREVGVESDEEAAGMVAEIQQSVRSAVREELDRMGKEYGWIQAGEKPFREVQIPKRTAPGNKVSQTVRTILEAEATPDEIIPNIEELVAKGTLSYTPYGDEEAVADAKAVIKSKEWDGAQRSWFADMQKGVVSKQNTALGWLLYNNAANSGNTKLALDILDEMVKSQRNAAQALQATRILKAMSPETQLYQAQQSVEHLQEQLTKKYGDKAPGLQINETLAEEYLNAKTEEARAKAMQKIYKDIGRQMPSRFIDKWNAWRYIAMLANPRTHIRNIVGNAGFAPVVAVKNLTAAAIESIVIRNADSRTKSVALASKEGRELMKLGWKEYSKIQEQMPEGKYSDFKNANKYIEEGRVIFGDVTKAKTGFGRVVAKTLGRGAEWVRKFNSKALATEDMWFSRPHYAAAFAQYCKAQGITAKQVEAGGKRIDAARAYAMKEAQKATYQDANALSNKFAQLARNAAEGDILSKAGNVLAEGVLPFRKTPANILVRGIEYSPVGLLKTIAYDSVRLSKGEISATEFIDNISAGLTGSVLLGFGFLLGKWGLIRGMGEEEKDKEKDFAELQGHQNYALELHDGTSVTLDWLAPEALPLFVGVNLWEAMQNNKDTIKLEDIGAAIGGISAPMLEMSCLQGLNDLIDSAQYVKADSAGLLAMAADAATSYLTQGLPTILGQIERTGEGTRMMTYTDRNKFWDATTQRTLGRVLAKIPGLDYGQIPYIDAWGRTESTGGPFERAFNNFLNPAYMSEVNTSEVETELQRLYDVTGETGVLPSTAPKYFTVSGERVDLTADQYVEYATYRGERAYDLVNGLYNSRMYRGLSDDLKRRAVEKCYEVANSEAKALVSSYELGEFYSNMAKAELAGVSNEVFVIFYVVTGNMTTYTDKNGNEINVAPQVREWLRNSGLSRTAKEALWSTRYTSAY